MAQLELPIPPSTPDHESPPYPSQLDILLAPPRKWTGLRFRVKLCRFR